MQQNIIWTNDTDQIDAIIDDWKQEAAHLATAMAENPKKPIEENDLRALLRASRPLGPLVREVYGMPAPAKKHGNR